MDKPHRCEIISWPRFASLARRLAFKIHAAGYKPDLIVAIARGGYTPARVLADYLGVMNMASIKVEHYRGRRKAEKAFIRQPLPDKVSGQRILVVDDVSDTGDTFAAALPHLRERLPRAEIRTAVLLHKACCPDVPDFYARKIVKWRWVIYPWAAMEDLTAMLATASLPIRDMEAFARFLQQQDGLKVPHRVLRDVLDLARYQVWP